MSQILKGGIILSLGLLISKMMSLLYIIPLYKIGGEEIGLILSYVFIPFTVLLILATFGILSTVTKLTAQYEGIRRQKLISSAWKLITITSLISFLILFFFSEAFVSLIIDPSSDYYNLTVTGTKVISFALLLVPLNYVIKGFLQGSDNYKVVSISNIIEQVTKVGAILFVTYLFYSGLISNFATYSNLVILSTVIAAAVTMLFFYLFIKKTTPNQFRYHLGLPDYKDLKIILLACVPILMTALIPPLFQLIDLITFSLVFPNHGYTTEQIEIIISNYEFWAMKLILIPQALLTGFTISLISNLAKEKNEHTTKNKIQKSILSVIFFGTITASFIWLHSTEIFSIVYGANEPGIQSLKLLSITIFFWMLRIVLVTILFTIGKNKQIFIITIITLVSKLLLNLTATSLVGVNTATIIALSIAIIYSLIAINNNYKIINLKLFKNIIFIASSVILYFIIEGVIQNLTAESSNLIKLSIGGIIYIIYIATGIIFLKRKGDKNEKHLSS